MFLKMLQLEHPAINNGIKIICIFTLFVLVSIEQPSSDMLFLHIHMCTRMHLDTRKSRRPCWYFDQAYGGSISIRRRKSCLRAALKSSLWNRESPSKDCKYESLKISLAQALPRRYTPAPLYPHPFCPAFVSLFLPLTSPRYARSFKLDPSRLDNDSVAVDPPRCELCRVRVCFEVLRSISFSLSFVSASTLFFLPFISIRPSPSSYRTCTFSPSLCLSRLSFLLWVSSHFDRAIVL